MARQLWPHQQQMLRYAYETQHPVLFVDPRMGKSTVFIRRAKAYKPRAEELRVLIIAPTSAHGSWIEELELEGEPSWQTLDGTRTERLLQLGAARKWNIAHPDIHLHIPEIARQDHVDWDCVCIDESTCIKNFRTRRARFWLNRLDHVRHRWVMTGTPNPEHLLEFWPQLAFCDGFAFGFTDWWVCRKKLFTVVDNKWCPLPGTRKRVEKYVAGRACVMRRKDWNLEPTKHYVTRSFELPADLKKAYRKMEHDFELQLNGSVLDTTVWAGTRYTWMRRLAGGWFDKELVCEDKVNDLVHLLDGEYHGDAVVVWAGFLLEIDHITRRLAQAGRRVQRLTGKVEKVLRMKAVDQFNKGKLDTLVIQHAVGEMGMRLSRADVSIYYSNPLGNLMRTQTEDRNVHLSKLERELTVIEMITKGTIDEDISKGLRMKSLGSTGTMDAILRQQFNARRRR